jgi:hypothetical protein
MRTHFHWVELCWGRTAQATAIATQAMPPSGNLLMFGDRRGGVGYEVSDDRESSPAADDSANLGECRANHVPCRPPRSGALLLAGGDRLVVWMYVRLPLSLRNVGGPLICTSS